MYEEGETPLMGRPAFEASKLDLGKRDERALLFHRELIALRKRMVGPVDAAVLGVTSMCVRWPGHLLLLDLGNDRRLSTPSEPLLAPPAGKRWKLLFSSELDRFGSALQRCGAGS